MGSAITKNILEAVAGVAIVTSLGVMGILSLLWTVALALFLGLIVLSVRQVVIILCIVLAPFAIASYVLPGTQKIWGFWKNTFLTTLMMYPIIMMFLAAGRGAANIIGSNNTSGLMNIMAVLLYFAPYFMLPFAFKMAGGLMSTIFSIANDKERGLFDRAKKFRQGRMSKNWQDMRAGNRFKGKNVVSRGTNRALEYGTNADSLGFNPKQMRSKMRTRIAANSHDEASKFMKENADFNTISGDDAKLAGARYTNRNAIQDELARFDKDRFGVKIVNGVDVNARARTDAATQILQAQRGASQETFKKARARAMAGTGTGYQRNGAVDYSRMIDDINEAYGNDRNGAGRALAEMRGALTNSGHIAGQAGFGTWANAMEQRYLNSDGFSEKDAHDLIMADAIDSAQPGHAIYGKPTSAAAMGEAHYEKIQKLASSMATGTAFEYKDAAGNTQSRVATQEDLDAATAAAAGILDAMNQASPQNASAFANQLMGKTVVGGGTPASGTGLVDANGRPISSGARGPDMTVREMIESRMQNQQFVIRRKDYGASVLSDAQRQAHQLVTAQQPARPGAPQGPSFTPPSIRF
jgi:hypothetical protein